MRVIDITYHLEIKRQKQLIKQLKMGIMLSLMLNIIILVVK
jgi:hypothetical protein